MTAIEVYKPGSIGESIVVFGNLASQIAKTDFVPQEFRGRPEAVLACMMYGQELGLGPMQSLNLTQSIKGRVGLKPEGMRALVLAAGHHLWTDEFTDSRVVLCGQRAGLDKVESVDWTLERAKQAGLGTGDNWKKYPRAMLLARATSELCRLLFADVVGGLSYTPDELEEFDVVDAVPRRPVVRETPAELPRGAMTPTRPRDVDVVVDTPPVDVETGEVLAPPSRVRSAPKKSVPLASLEDRDAIALLLKQFDGDERKELMGRWSAAGIESFKAAERFTADDAARAFDLLAEFQRERLAPFGEDVQPTLDGA